MTPRFYGPLTALAYLFTAAYSSLSTAFCRLLTCISCRHLSTSCHLSQSLSILHPPSGLLLTTAPYATLIKYPNHSTIFCLKLGTLSQNNRIIKSFSLRRENIGEMSNTEGTLDGQSERRNHDADRIIDETFLGHGR
jgi:hypothetical protein